jgi:hypothetical protein
MLVVSNVIKMEYICCCRPFQNMDIMLPKLGIGKGAEHLFIMRLDMMHPKGWWNSSYPK